MSRPAKMTTKVLKWENGRVVEVNPRDKGANQKISDEKRKERYENERAQSINQKRNG